MSLPMEEAFKASLLTKFQVFNQGAQAPLVAGLKADLIHDQNHLGDSLHAPCPQEQCRLLGKYEF